MATPTPIRKDRERSLQVMKAVDAATKQALADLGLEAFRFDIDICPEEQWMRVKVKIRPVGRT